MSLLAWCLCLSTTNEMVFLEIEKCTVLYTRYLYLLYVATYQKQRGTVLAIYLQSSQIHNKGRKRKDTSLENFCGGYLRYL